MPLVEVESVQKSFLQSSGVFGKKVRVQALKGVSLSIERGETLGLVGESGCGKSTLGKCILKLIEWDGGEIRFRGQSLTHLTNRQMKPLRRQIQIIFQDPYSSLNPRLTIGRILEEPLIIHKLAKTAFSRRARVEELLALVGLPKNTTSRYPHEFSGGQRQRVGIARALAVEPEFIVCDEPVSALDVSIQAQIVNLLLDLQKKLGLTYLFISHDLRVVQLMSHRVAVMYLGRVVEIADYRTIYSDPLHPYTKLLLSAIPRIGQNSAKVEVGGEPIQRGASTGCVFYTRCPLAEDRCRNISPPLEALKSNPNHKVACLLVE